MSLSYGHIETLRQAALDKVTAAGKAANVGRLRAEAKTHSDFLRSL